MKTLTRTEIKSNHLLAILAMFAEDSMDKNQFDAMFAYEHWVEAYIVVEGIKFSLSYESCDPIYLSVEIDGNKYSQELFMFDGTDILSYDIWEVNPYVLELAIDKLQTDLGLEF